MKQLTARLMQSRHEQTLSRNRPTRNEMLPSGQLRLSSSRLTICAEATSRADRLRRGSKGASVAALSLAVATADVRSR
jgi:hypothetical protein